MAINLVADIGGQEYRETLWVTNKKGENFFYNKDDNSKKVQLPSFTIVNDLCIVTLEKELFQLATEDKVVNIWDSDAKKELPKSVPVITDLIGQEALFAITKQIVNKSEKKGDTYVDIADSREENVIEKVFHGPSKMTVGEATAPLADGVERVAKFHDAWIERNRGKTKDKRKIKDDQGGKSTGAPPQAGASSAPRTSLFGAKS